MVFARAPVAGAAKTRMIPLLGAAGAAALHGRLIRRALATARSASTGTIALWCAPDAENPFLRSAAQQFQAALHVQHGDDLGARMADAFTATLEQSACAVCIGADCPALTPAHLHQAMAALRDGNDAVFAPAEDGGYVLVGLARATPQLFAGIAWGESTVMAQTREHLHELGLRWQELETLWDVDRPEDYLRLQQSGLMDDLPSPA